MYMRVSFSIFLSILLTVFVHNTSGSGNMDESTSESKLIYDQLNYTSLSYEAFDMAYRGWFELKDSLQLKENIISVVDYSQPSTQKRFYLVDLVARKVIYHNYVAHGKNTGELMAKKFSNKPKSLQSSLGFFRTAETYYGKHGLSLKLDGLEGGINHLARERHIVIHAAYYAEESFIKKYGRLGRSFGCPALPSAMYKEVIEQIRDGVLLFIYYPEPGYIENSSVLN